VSAAFARAVQALRNGRSTGATARSVAAAFGGAAILYASLCLAAVVAGQP